MTRGLARSPLDTIDHARLTDGEYDRLTGSPTLAAAIPHSRRFSPSPFGSADKTQINHANCHRSIFHPKMSALIGKMGQNYHQMRTAKEKQTMQWKERNETSH